MMPHSHTRSAFTLVELLTVIAIIGLLTAILIPTTGVILQRAALSKCVANLSAIGAGMMLFSSENGGYLPGNGAAKNERWFNTVAPYVTGADSKLIGRDQEKYPGQYIRAIPDPNRSAVFRCPNVEPDVYIGTPSEKRGIYRCNINIILKEKLLGYLLSDISYPSRAVLLADCYCGEDAVSATQMNRNDPPYPQGAKTGPAANHRADGDAGADPMGAGLCPMLFADGHAEAIELESLRPWAECTHSNETSRPKGRITMMP